MIYLRVFTKQEVPRAYLPERYFGQKVDNNNNNNDNIGNNFTHYNNDQNVSEHEQKMSQSQTVDKPMASLQV